MKDALGSVQSVLVLGGGSDIALATAKALARGRRIRIVLAGRKPEALDAAATELHGVGANVESVEFDATDFASHEAFVQRMFAQYGDFDVVIVAFGVLGDQTKAENDAAAALDIVQTNYTGAVSIGVPLAQRMREQGHGTLVLLSSVAGERARRSNFIYGSSKAGVDAFYQGLGDSLVGSGARVMIVRPGFVHTKMTAGLKAAPFSTTPEKVADAVATGLRRGSRTVWVPAAIRPIFSVFRHLPGPVWRRLPV